MRRHGADKVAGPRSRRGNRWHRWGSVQIAVRHRGGALKTARGDGGKARCKEPCYCERDVAADNASPLHESVPPPACGAISTMIGARARNSRVDSALVKL